MNGSASLTVKTATLQKLLPKAINAYEDEGLRDDKDPESAMFDMKGERPVEIFEITDESISFSFDTPFGHLWVSLTPDREFLQKVTEVAVARVNKAIAILENGNIRS